MSMVTAPLRFITSCGVNNTMRRFCVNMIPTPRLHFFQQSLYTTPSTSQYSTSPLLSTSQVTDLLYDVRYSLTAYNYGSLCPSTDNAPKKIRHTHDSFIYANSLFFRGPYPSSSDSNNNNNGNGIDSVHHQINNQYSKSYFDWLPSAKCVDYLETPPLRRIMDRPYQAGLAISNSRVTQQLLERIREEFSNLYKRKAFLMWYS